MSEPETTLPAPTLAFQPTELDNQVNSFINDLAAKYEAEDNAVDVPDPAAATTETVAPETPVTEQTLETELTKDDPSVTRGLDRLVAREVELRAREDRLKGQETEVETLRTRMRELESRTLSEELLNQIKLSPHTGLRALGLDPDEVVRTALMEKIGDKATPEMREMLEKTQMKREIAAVRAQLQASEQKQAAQAFYNQVSNGAIKFAQDAEGLSKHSPTVATVARANPERVYQEIMGEISTDAAARSAKGDQGDVITYEEAAKRVESRWSSMRSLFLPQNPAVPIPEASTPTPKTTVVAKPAPTTIKPPDKPLAPWLTRPVDEEEAIAAAILDWKRQESTKTR